MKKLTALFLTLVLTLSLGACSTNSSTKSPISESGTSMTGSSQTPSETEGTPSNETKETANALVVYFSMPETTNPDNMTQEEDNSVVVIGGEVLGNTQYVAYVIQENTKADIFRIEPENPYPTDHETLVDLAKEEQKPSLCCRPISMNPGTAAQAAFSQTAQMRLHRCGTRSICFCGLTGIGRCKHELWNASSQRTVITNTEFAGYYNDEVIFTLNKDETQTKKTTVDGELTVGKTKFVPMPTASDGLNIVILD